MNYQSFVDGMTLVGSFVIMVALIVAVYYASRWYAGRMKVTAAGKYVKIVDRVPLGPGCALLVVQAGDQFYLLGQSDKSVTLICELRDFDVSELAEPQQQATFAQMYKNFMDRAGRNSSQKDDGIEK